MHLCVGGALDDWQKRLKNLLENFEKIYDSGYKWESKAFCWLVMSSCDVDALYIVTCLIVIVVSFIIIIIK